MLNVFFDCRGIEHSENWPQNSTNITDQAPYSPDLTTVDFFLFPKLKYDFKFAEGTKGDPRSEL